MVSNSKIKKFAIIIGYYALLALLVCILMKIFFRLPIHDFFHIYEVPFDYTGDAYGALLYAQNFISGGGYYSFGNMSAPFGWNNPASLLELLDISLLYIGSLFSDKPGLIVNVIYLLSYPVIGIISTYAFKKLGINSILAFAGGIIYTFLPYHYMRNIGHIWLALYYFVPLICLISVWLMQGETITVLYETKITKYRLLQEIKNKKMLYASIMCIAVPFGDAYGAYFALICITFASVYCSVKRRSMTPIIEMIILNLIIIFGIFIQFIPTLLSGKPAFEKGIATRPFSDSEYYGLKIVQLLLPVLGHRFPPFAKIASLYNSSAPLITENRTATLGLFASVGFLISIGTVFFKRSNNGSTAKTDLGYMNLFLVLVATIGGFGVLIALFASSVIRCYNRISTYIAFFSLIVILLYIQQAYNLIINKIKNTKRKLFGVDLYRFVSIILSIFVLALSLFAVYDQVNITAAVNQPVNEWKNDDDFIKAIENSVPMNSMVFELPAVGPQGYLMINDKFSTYDLWKPVVHSKILRWSASFSDNDISDKWNNYVGRLTPEEMLKTISLVGFDGLYIDSYAYTNDDFRQLCNSIENVIHSKPIISNNSRLYFYNITEYATAIRSVFKVDSVYGKTFYASDVVPYIEYISGWYEKEDWGIWSQGKISNLFLILPTGLKSQEIRITLDIDILPQPQGLNVSFKCKDKMLYSGILHASGKVTFLLPRSYITENGLTNIAIIIENPIKPKSIGINDDVREIGIGIKEIEIMQ